MQLKVRGLDGLITTVRVDPSETILNVKKKVHEQNEIKVDIDLMKLVFKGKVLNNEDTIAQLKMKEEDYIVILVIAKKQDKQPVSNIKFFQERDTATVKNLEQTKSEMKQQKMKEIINQRQMEKVKRTQIIPQLAQPQISIKRKEQFQKPQNRKVKQNIKQQVKQQEKKPVKEQKQQQFCGSNQTQINKLMGMGFAYQECIAAFKISSNFEEALENLLHNTRQQQPQTKVRQQSLVEKNQKKEIEKELYSEQALQQAIKELIELGFSEKDSIQAYYHCNQNCDQAANYLLEKYCN